MTLLLLSMIVVPVNASDAGVDRGGKNAIVLAAFGTTVVDGIGAITNIAEQSGLGIRKPKFV